MRIIFDEYGRYVAARQITGSPANLTASGVCPFGDAVPNEDELAQDIFGDLGSTHPCVGKHVGAYAGWVVESDYRAKGSSGGMASWLLVELLSRNLVDYIVHVAAEPFPKAGNPLFRFSISSSVEQVRTGQKSRYYPVEMSRVIAEMLRKPGRYAVVGIPCFVKALRLACRESAILKERLTFAVGIVCGHLKSTGFTEMLAWECGVVPSELRAIDFRTKLPDRPASNYAATFTGKREDRTFTVTKPMAELFGSNWGLGFFKYKACDFCDDVVAETADISFGDAWPPEYASDSQGTNVVVVRSKILDSILAQGKAEGRVHLDSLPVEKIVESQAGGFRHRRDGLAYRLALEDASGRWRPAKRVKPSTTHLSRKLRRVHELRQELRETSHAAFASAKQKEDFGEFLKIMKPLTHRYLRLYESPLLYRALGKLKRSAVSICRWLGALCFVCAHAFPAPRP